MMTARPDTANCRTIDAITLRPHEDIVPFETNHEEPSTDWKMAVTIATARLQEHFGNPGPCGDSTTEVLANDLAALFCAYGKIDEERERMRAHHLDDPEANRTVEKTRWWYY